MAEMKTMTTELGSRIQQALIDVRVARLTRGPNGRVLAPEQLAELVDAASNRLDSLLDEVTRN
jgi:hypothetical protein